LPAGNVYTIVKYTGALQGNFNNTVGLVPSVPQPSRYAFSLSYPANQVQLTVNASTASLKWNNAQANGIWDVTNNFNWLNTTGATNDYFAQLDSVLFDDSILAGPSNAVSVATAVAPGSVTVDTTNIYAISGSGKITGATGLIKNGAGTLTVGNTGNDYSGATLINSGTLVVNAANALGSGTNTVTVANGATLDLGG